MAAELEKLQDFQRDYEGFEDQRKEMTKRLNEKNNQIQEISSQRGDIDKSYHALKSKIDKTKTEIDSVTKSIRFAEKQIQDFDKRIQEIRRKEKGKDADKERREQAIIDTEARIRQHQESIEQMTKNREEAEIKHRTIIQDGREVDERRKVISENITKCTRTLQRLQHEKQDKIKKFGEKMPEFLALIQQNSSKFESLPIGPVGLLVTPKDHRWDVAIERHMHRSISDFVVHSHKDEALLKQMAQRLRIKVPSIIVQKHSYQIYDTTRNRPDKRYMAIQDAIDLDMQNISNVTPIKYDSRNNYQLLRATLFNMLVDQLNIENTILIDTYDNAGKVMFPRPPDNVYKCYTQSGTSLHVASGRSQVVMTYSGKSRFWGSNAELQIRETEEQISSHQHELHEVNELIKNNKQEAVQAQQAISEIRAIIAKSTRAVTQMERQLQDLKAPLEEESTEDATVFMQESIKSKETEIQEYQKKIDEINVLQQQYIEELKPLAESKREKDEEKNRITVESDELRKELTKLLKKQTSAKSKESSINNQVRQYQAMLDGSKAASNKLHQELDEAKKKATDVCPERVEINRSANDILAERQALIERIRQEEKRMGSRSVGEITRTYLNYRKHYDDNYQKVQISKDRLKEIREGLTERMKRWRTIRKDFAILVNHKFNTYLSQKGHTGSIRFDHEEESLDISIQLESQRPTEKFIVKDSKSLSGGERSYSTVAFLLALWEVVECPFRALDEFDIFMDAVYRKKSIELLLEIAQEKQRRRQLIIITPHDTSVVKLNQNIKMHRLQRPDRGDGQTILDNYLSQSQ